MIFGAPMLVLASRSTNDLAAVDSWPVGESPRAADVFRRRGESAMGNILAVVGYAYMTMLLAMVGQRLVRGAGRDKPQVSVANAVLAINQGAGLSSLVGWFMIVAALFWSSLAVAALGIALEKFARAESEGSGSLLCGVAFLCVTLVVSSTWLGLGRWGVVIDSKRNAVLCWWGLAVPIWTRAYGFTDFTSLRIVPKQTQGWFRLRRSTAIHLEGRDRVLCLCVLDDSRRAHALARRVATLTQLPLQDATAYDVNGGAIL